MAPNDTIARDRDRDNMNDDAMLRQDGRADAHLRQDDRLTLLIDNPSAIKVVLAWPTVAHVLSAWDQASHVALATGLEIEEVRPLLDNLVACGAIRYGGTIDPAVKNYIDRLGLAKQAGVAAFDPAHITAKFLGEMTLAQRMDWLVDNNLLE